MAMTLLATGLISEAIPALRRSGKHLHHLEAYRGELSALLSEVEGTSLRDQWFSRLRNEAVFHNDSQVSSQGCATLRPRVPQDVARGSTSSGSDTYYPLADTVALLYVTRVANESETPVQFLEKAVDTVLTVGIQMCNAIDSVIGQGLRELDLQWEETDETAG